MYEIVGNGNEHVPRDAMPDVAFKVHAIEDGPPQVHERHVDVVPESLVPGEVVYARPEHFVVNRAGSLFIDSGASFTDAMCPPAELTDSSIGFMVALSFQKDNPNGGQPTSREYIADLRYATPHSLRQTMYGAKRDSRPDTSYVSDDDVEPLVFLLITGCVDLDEHGKVEYFGPRRLVESAEHLVNTVDQARMTGTAGETHETPTDNTTEVAAPIEASPAAVVLRHALAGDWEAAHKAAVRR